MHSCPQSPRPQPFWARWSGLQETWYSLSGSAVKGARSNESVKTLDKVWPKPAGFLIFQDTPVNSSPSKGKNTPRFITAYDHFLTPFLFLDNFYKETDERCTCPVPCETISFNPVLSFATFPSEKYIIEATNKHVGNVSKEERLKFREFIRYKTGGEAPSKWLLVSLSKDVLEGRTLSRSAVFSFLGNDFPKCLVKSSSWD